ncbi:kinase-like domain-containing protein [Flammula alnicola]|nr:kinase-like domain-containing protein [Flammula alnicola]
MSQFPEEPLNLPSSEGFGYFPAYPGLQLNKDQYEIIRKLGYGPRSSAWLAMNSEINEYLVVKIFTACETLQEPSYELDALEVAATAKEAYINLYPTFTETSHHGKHLCLVLDVAGPSFEDLRLSSPTKSLPRHIVQRAIACAVEDLQKLHNMCGLIHGAVTAGNLVFEIDASRAVLDRALATLPPCTIEKRISVDGVEYPVVRSHPVPYRMYWNASWAAINRCIIKLINFGHAQKKTSSPTWEKSRMDKSLRPPEVILGLPYSLKVDVWMLGCATYYMLTGKPLVPEEKAADDGVMLGWLIAMSGGRIPPEVALKSKKAEYFNELGTFKLEIPMETLQSQISSCAVVQAEDISGVVEFIQACLTLDPASRPTPDDLFQAEWVQPGFEG